MWTWRCEQPGNLSSCDGQRAAEIVSWSEVAKDSATGSAFNIRCSSASPSSSALPAESYLSWLSSSSNSPLGLWLSHLARKMQPKPALSLRGERERCVLAGKNSSNSYLHHGIKCQMCVFFCQNGCPLSARRLFRLKKVNKISQNTTLIPFSSFITSQLPRFYHTTQCRESTTPWPDFICKRHHCCL